MVDCSFERVERPYVPAEAVANIVSEAEEDEEKMVEIAPGVFGPAEDTAKADEAEATEAVEPSEELYEEIPEEIDLTPDNEKPGDTDKKTSFWEKMFGGYSEKEKEKKEEEKKPEPKVEKNSKFIWKKFLDKLDEAYDNIDKDNEV